MSSPGAKTYLRGKIDHFSDSYFKLKITDHLSDSYFKLKITDHFSDSYF